MGVRGPAARSSLEAVGALAVAAIVVLSVVVPGVAVSAAGLAAAASACTPIAGETVIDAPGCYVLTADIVNSPNATAIEIRSSDVVVDGGGHLANGTRSFGTRGVYLNGTVAPLTNVTVENLTVYEWYHGVVVEGVSGANLRDLIADDNSREGVWLDEADDSRLENVTARGNGQYGLRVFRSDRNVVSLGNFSENSNGIGLLGIQIDRTVDNRIENTTASDNRFDGIVISQSRHNAIVDSTVDRNDGVGIGFALGDKDGSVFNTFENTTVNGDGYYHVVNETGTVIEGLVLDARGVSNLGKITVVGSTDVTIRDVSLSHPDMSRSGSGISLYRSDRSTLSNVTVWRTDAGVEFSVSNDNTLSGSTLGGNYVGVRLTPPESTGNVIADSTLTGNWNGISVRADDTRIENTTIGDIPSILGVPPGDAIAVDADNTTIVGNRLDDNAGEGIVLRNLADGVDVRNNTISQHSEAGITFHTPHGVVLRDNALLNNGWALMFRTTGPQTPSAGISHFFADIDTSNSIDGRPIYYLVNVSDLTLSAGQDAGFVAAVNSRNVTVEDQYLTGSWPSLLFVNTSSSTVRNVTVENVDPYGMGMQVHRSDDNAFENNTVRDTGDGIYLVDTHRNVLRNNTVTDVDGAAITVASSRNTTIADNWLSAPVPGSPLPVSYVGLLARGSGTWDTLIRNNTIVDSRGGMTVTGSGTVVENNLVRGHVLAGIGMGFGVTARNNTVRDNGVGIGAGSATVVTDNILDGNDVGIEADGDDVLVVGNVITNSTKLGTTGYGLVLSRSERVTVTRNRLSGNDNGLSLDAARDSTVAGNTIEGSDRWGLHLRSAGFRSAPNLVYDNHLNNSANVRFDGTVYPNGWNVSPSPGPNVAGGPSLGGNVWAFPNGTGYSQTCADADADGFCDVPLALETGNVDHHPLSTDVTPRPFVAVLPTSVDYGSVSTGATAVRDVEVSNAGSAPLNVSATTIVGANASEFSVAAGGAPVVLAPGASTTVSVAFAPTSAGSKAAALRVESNDTTNPAVDVALSGVGVEDTPRISVDPASHDFGSVAVGATASHEFAVSNLGTVALDVTSTAILGADAGGFSIAAGGGPFVVAAGASRNVTVEFGPTADGAMSAVLRVESNDTDQPGVNVTLAATGVQPAPAVSVVPESVDFGGVAVGSTATEAVHVSNLGAVALNVTDTSVLGPNASEFAIASGGGGSVLAPGAVRTVTVAFTPTTAGAKTATLRIESNDTTSPGLDVPLAATGVAMAPNVSTSPASHAFGSVTVGSSATRTVTVSNAGAAAANVSATVLTGTGAGQFAIASGGGPVVLGPGASRDVSVRYAPTSAGSTAATLRIESNDSARPAIEVSLSGTGVAASSGGGSSGGSSGGGASSGGSAASRPPPAPRGPTVAVTLPAPDRAAVSVTNAGPSAPVRVELPTMGPSEATGGALTRLDVRLRDEASFTLEVRTSGTPPSEARGAGTPGGTDPVTYFDIRHSVSDAGIEGVGFTFRVTKARLAALGHAPAAVDLYRLADGRWTPLGASVAGETATAYEFAVESPGLSVFAIVAEKPVFAVRDASLSRTAVAPGESVGIEATVENTGAANGTYAAALVVDGSRVEERTVTVPAGGTAPVAFERTFDRPGSYVVAVGNASAGTLSVAADTPTPFEPATPAGGSEETRAADRPETPRAGAGVTDDGDAGSPAAEPGEFRLPGGAVLAGIAAVLLAVGLVVLYLRRTEPGSRL